jgi:hypothetical protein
MKFIKNVKLGGHAPSVKKLLHETLAKYEPARPIDKIHASSLTNDVEWCPREWALMDITGKQPQGQFIGTSLRTTFDNGNSYNDLMAMHWLVDYVVGDWLCLGCDFLHQFRKKPFKCSSCGCKALRYEEHRFQSQLSGSSGGIDFFVKLPAEPKLFAIEHKTIDKDQFRDLLAPKAEHTWRTKLYLRLISESDSIYKDRINLSKAFVLYTCRGFGFKDADVANWGLKDAPFSPFKEYMVLRDDDAAEIISQKSRSLWLYRKGEAGMPTGVCDTALCTRAKKCNMVKECWSGKYPEGVKNDIK